MKHDYYDHAFLHFLFADYKEIETTRTGEHFFAPQQENHFDWSYSQTHNSAKSSFCFQQRPKVRSVQ